MDKDSRRPVILLAGDWPNAGKWASAAPDWQLETVDAAGVLQAIARFHPAWLLIGEVGGELAGQRLAEAAFHLKFDLLIGVFGPRDDPDLCDRWAHHGARVYLDPSAEPRRVVRFLEASEELDALVIDEDLQRTALAQRQQAIAEIGGKVELREDELRIVRMLAMATTNVEISEELAISGRTIERHLSELYVKLAVKTRAEAVRRAHDLGL